VKRRGEGIGRKERGERQITLLSRHFREHGGFFGKVRYGAEKKVFSDNYKLPEKKKKKLGRGKRRVNDYTPHEDYIFGCCKGLLGIIYSGWGGATGGGIAKVREGGNDGIGMTAHPEVPAAAALC